MNFLSLSFLSTLLLLGGLASAAPAPQKVTFDRDGLEEDLAELKKQGEQGSSYAMQQLSRRYAVHRITDQATRWHERYVQQLIKEAEQGRSKSMLQLAALYLRGSEFLPPSRSDATTWLTRASAAGEPSAAYILADIHAHDKQAQLADQSYRRSYELYSKLLEHPGQKADALYWLGIMELHGQGRQKDASKAIAHFSQSAELGSRVALQRLFQCYASGIGVAKDKQKALSYARELADWHDQGAMAFLLASSYLDGDGVPVDKALGEHYLQRACDLQLPAAYTRQGLEWMAGAKRAEALELFHKAAQLGDVRALRELGEYAQQQAQTAEGDVREAWQIKTVLYLTQAVELHDPVAAWMLAEYYQQQGEEGLANGYIVKASDGGLREAMGARGLLHMLPHSNMDWNPTLAYQWWELGAEAGDATATRYLNIFLYGVIPTVLFVAFLLPILLMRFIVWRRKKRAAS